MSTWVISLVCLFIGCYFFEKQAERTFGVDIHRATALLHDAEYRPIPSKCLQLAQLGLIFGTESLVGIIIGLMYGPITMIWCVIGTTFFGTGLVYYNGMYALSTGKTLNFLILKFFGKRIYYLLIGGLFVFVCLDICSKFVFIFNVNNAVFGYSLWLVVLLLVAVVCLLSPRNFINLCMATGSMILLSTGYFLLMSLTRIEKLPINFNPWSLRELKFAYPFLFFTLSAGAICGSQALKSIILAPYIKNEKKGTSIFWRTMFVHTGIMIIWNMMILSWNPTREFIVSLVYSGANIYETLSKGLAYNIWGGQYLLYVTCLLIGLTSIVALMRAMSDILLETKNYPSSTLYVIETGMLIFCFVIYPLALNYSFSSMNSLVITTYMLFLLIIYLKSKQKSTNKYKLIILFLIGVIVSQFVLQVHKQDLLESIMAGLLVSLLVYLLVYYKELFRFVKNIRHARKRRKVIVRQKRLANEELRLAKHAQLLHEQQQRQLAQERETAALKAMEEEDKKRQDEALRAENKNMETKNLTVAQKTELNIEKNKSENKRIADAIPSGPEAEGAKASNKRKKKRKKKKSAKPETQAN